MLKDSEFPIERLRLYLERNVPGFQGFYQAIRLQGGRSNPTYLINASSGRYVLRHRPVGNLLPSAHAVDREYRVLCALDGTVIPVPKPLHLSTDTSIIGTPFYIMAYVEGRTYHSPLLPELRPSARGLIYEQMNRLLVALYSIDPDDIGLHSFGAPLEYSQRQIDRWTRQYRASETARITVLEELIDWLPRNLPADSSGGRSLVHGDFRLDNMLFDAKTHRVTALIDWELSTIGGKYADLAYQCAQWRLPAERKELRGLGGVDRAKLGIPEEEEHLQRFCEAIGIEHIPDWNFYLALSFFRLAAICQGIYRRGLDRTLPSDQTQMFADAAQCIAETAHDILS